MLVVATIVMRIIQIIKNFAKAEEQFVIFEVIDGGCRAPTSKLLHPVINEARREYVCFKLEK